MSRLDAILSEIFSLSTMEESILLNILEERKVLKGYASDMTNEVRENRFSRGECCPHCKSEAVCKNGTYKRKQRYVCKSCNKTFSDLTHSPNYNSKKSIDKWIQYAKCMIAGYSIARCAREVGISIPTAFYWRHKIMDAIKEYIAVGHVDGVVEIDDTFIRASYKGRHTENSVFKMPRKPYKRGVKTDPNKPKEEKRKRGLSKDQIGIMCAIDRNGNIIAEPISRGMASAEAIENLFKDRMGEDTIACVDSCRSFIKFAKNTGIELQRIKSGKKKEGIYHIQHVNSFHSKLKTWLMRFKGVATKYLSSYLSWFRWLELFKTEKEAVKVKNLLIHTHTALTTARNEDFVLRQMGF